MPDGKTWFAQNLNYSQGLTYNAYVNEANGKAFTNDDNGIPAIGSYWCPSATATLSGNQNMCNVYGALYTWETAMMVDGKYADETKTSRAWDESWVSGNYYTSGAPGTEPNADKNNARGGTTAKGGGRGICPMGWHIPTDREWVQLLDAVEGDGKGNAYSVAVVGVYLQPADSSRGAGTKLKSKLTYSGVNTLNGAWLNPMVPHEDTYGFGAVPAGNRNGYYDAFASLSATSYHWSSTAQNALGSICWVLGRHESGAGHYGNWRAMGESVRCMKE
jgi:uncharacterized protein (TIGR02145 family)